MVDSTHTQRTQRIFFYFFGHNGGSFDSMKGSCSHNSLGARIHKISSVRFRIHRMSLFYGGWYSKKSMGARAALQGCTEYRALFKECRARLIGCRALLTECWAFLKECRACLIGRRALLKECRALLRKCRALLKEFSARLIA